MKRKHGQKPYANSSLYAAPLGRERKHVLTILPEPHVIDAQDTEDAQDAQDAAQDAQDDGFSDAASTARFDPQLCSNGMRPYY